MRILLALLMLAAALGAGAAEPLRFDSDEQRERFERLTGELRCVVCQNQSLADSDAPLAHDLREEIHAMVLQGTGDDDIKRFLVERYGEFVLYRPPVKGNTLFLWLAPGLLLAIGAAVVVRQVLRRNRQWAQEESGRTPENGA